MKKQKERVNPRNRLLYNVDNRDQRAIVRISRGIKDSESIRALLRAVINLSNWKKVFPGEINFEKLQKGDTFYMSSFVKNRNYVTCYNLCWRKSVCT